MKQRPSDLARARDRAELLLAEVNHRVANSLSLVASLVKLQSNAVPDKAAKDALAETQARIYRGLLGAQAALRIGRRALGGARRISDQPPRAAADIDARRGARRLAQIRARAASSCRPTRASTSRVVVTEWVTNAFKYAYPDRGGEVRVRLKRLAEIARNSPWRTTASAATTSAAKGTGLGTRIVRRWRRPWARKSSISPARREPRRG